MELVRMVQFRDNADERLKALAVEGCVVLSCAQFLRLNFSAFADITADEIGAWFILAKANGSINELNRVTSYDKFFATIGVNVSAAKVTQEDFKEGLVFVTKHCFYGVKPNTEIFLMDPGYQRDVKFDQEGFAVNISGTRSRDSIGNPRKIVSCWNLSI